MCRTNGLDKLVFYTLLALSGVVFAARAEASTIPYPDKGKEAPAQSFVAEATGDLVAYFYGASAGYTNTIGLSVNSALRASGVFDDHMTKQGAAYDFGSVSKGDVLTFFIDASFKQDTNRYYSDPTLNTDNFNHAYSTAYSGGMASIPAGTYVGFEDLKGGGDMDYNDEQFVYVVHPSAVPLPASAPMFGAALAVLGVVGYRASRRNSATAA